MKHVSKSTQETNKIAEGFLKNLKPREHATIVALHGNLGAGKTAFTKEVGNILGVIENMYSPTFVIEKIYNIDFKCFKRLIHIDAYRLEKPARPDDSGHSGGESELLHLGWEELIKEPKNLIFIEWPENVSGIIPDYAKRIYFEFIDDKTREIKYED